MLLMTVAHPPPGFWSYPDWPRRAVRPRPPAGEDWRGHPLAPTIAMLLAERGLDEWDIDLFVDDETLWVYTACWVHDLRVGTGSLAAADAAAKASEVLAPELDHLLALRRREAMIAAAQCAGDSGRWVTPATEEAAGGVGAAPTSWSTGTVPLWAVTASQALLAHLARIRMTPLAALRRAVAKPRDPNDAATWAELAGVRVHYQNGRLHAREHIGEHTLDDWYGLTLNLAGHDLPDTAMAAAAGGPLSRLAAFATPPALLAGADPAITGIKRVGSPWTIARRAGLLVGLDTGTETLASVPASALAAVGDGRERLTRSEIPWVSPEPEEELNSGSVKAVQSHRSAAA